MVAKEIIIIKFFIIFKQALFLNINKQKIKNKLVIIFAGIMPKEMVVKSDKIKIFVFDSSSSFFDNNEIYNNNKLLHRAEKI